MSNDEYEWYWIHVTAQKWSECTTYSYIGNTVCVQNIQSVMLNDYVYKVKEVALIKKNIFVRLA